MKEGSEDDEDPVVGQPFRGGGIVTRIEEQEMPRPPNDRWKVTRKIVTMTSGIIFLVDLYVDNVEAGAATTKTKHKKKKNNDESVPARKTTPLVETLPPRLPRRESTGPESTFSTEMDGLMSQGSIARVATSSRKPPSDAEMSPQKPTRKSVSDTHVSHPLAISELTTSGMDSLPAESSKEQVAETTPQKPTRKHSTGGDSAFSLAISELTTPEMTGVSRASSGKRQTSTTEERLQDTEPAEIPMNIFVYSKNDPDLPSIIRQVESSVALSSESPDSSDDQPRYGVWALHEDDSWSPDEEEDVVFWKPQGVTLWLDTDPSLDTIPEVSEDGDTVASGIWGYASDCDSRFEAGGDRDTSLQHALVVPPRRRIPQNFVPAGRYTFKSDSSPAMPTRMSSRLDATWPPPVDHVRKQLHNVGKLRMPTCFEENDKKVAAKVFPKSKLSPATKLPKVVVSKKGESVLTPIGHWEYPKGQEKEDEYFLPVDVDLYWGNDRPQSRGTSGASTDGSMDSWGLWGTSSADESLVSDDDWQPERPIVFPPGLEPDLDPDISIMGRWAYRTDQANNLEWPPSSVKFATVHSSSSISGIASGRPKGVWRFPGMEDQATKEGWDPVEVELWGEGESCSYPSGAWGIRKGAEPDHNYDWKPQDINFYPPGVKPSDDTWVQGKWTMKQNDVGKLQSSWPPPASKKASLSTSMGKLTLNRAPQEAWVHPIQSLPLGRHGEGFAGAWKVTADDEPKQAVWKPQLVMLVGNDDVVDASKPFGYWGVNMEAKGVEIDDVQAKDIWFYPPGQKPTESECNVQGRWTFPSSKLDRSWPPPSLSPVASPRRSVAKLKIPGAFANEVSSGSVKFATVHSSSNISGIASGRPKGVWRFPGMEDQATKEGWDPVEVELWGEGESCSYPSGAWGIRKGAEPDHNYDWKPQDINFYPPGVKPSDDTWVQGKWTMKQNDVGKLQSSWPPPASKKASLSTSMGKLTLNRAPQEAWVHPIQSLPLGRHGEGFAGAWKVTADDEPKQAVWKPQLVMLVGNDDVVDASKPFGYWGVNMEAKGVEIDDVQAKDIWFYPPGQKPTESECNVQGRWTFPSSKLDRSWPPPSLSPVASPRRSVAKLKIPGAFASEVSSGAHGMKPKLPSLFTHSFKKKTP